VLSSIGPLEIGIVLVIVLLIFGPKKLPQLGKSLGSGIRDFGRGLKGEDDGEATAEAKTEEGMLPRG
jgi:sec-independent protein translocase protein TatA